MLDTDLEGLGPQEAAEYVLAFITTLKKTEKDLALQEEEVALWTRRAALAREKGETALADQAQTRLNETLAKQSQLEGEVRELRASVSVLKQKLVKLRAMGTRLVDADLLLAQLQMLVGEKDALNDAFKNEEAAQRLEELKKRAAEEK
jgi:hypothetical protein